MAWQSAIVAKEGGAHRVEVQVGDGQGHTILPHHEEEVEDHARLCPGPLLSQIALCADRDDCAWAVCMVRPTCRRAA